LQICGDLDERLFYRRRAPLRFYTAKTQNRPLAEPVLLENPRLVPTLEKSAGSPVLGGEIQESRCGTTEDVGFLIVG
jgi:hypothetical protein